MFSRHIAWLLALVVTACSPARHAPADGEIAEAQGAIIDGTIDMTHSAVVSFSDGNSMCTATVIDVRGRRAVALTAAHCCRYVDPSQVTLLGGENAFIAVSESVSNLVMDRAYDGRSHDVCLIEFSIEPSVRGTVEPARWRCAPEDLRVGEPLDLVGYGWDETNIGQRRHVQVTLSSVEKDVVRYDQSAGGACHGDSGGPGFVVRDGMEVIAAVISRGDSDCQGEGVSGRVSTIAESFIGPFIDGQPQCISCSACARAAVSTVGACADDRMACLDEPACNALVSCIAECTTSACVNDCRSIHSEGIIRYDAMTNCALHETCADVCDGNVECIESVVDCDAPVFIEGGGCTMAPTEAQSFAWAWLLVLGGLARRLRLQSARWRFSHRRPNL